MPTTKTISTTQSEAGQVSTLAVGDCFFKMEDTAFANIYQVTNVPPPAPDVIVAVCWITGVVENVQIGTSVLKVSAVAIGVTL